MNLTGKKITFHRKEKTYIHPYRVGFLLAVIFGLVFLIRALDSGAIKRPYEPTPTSTRTNNSYMLEAQTHFQSGNLPAAIEAYKSAIQLNPNDGDLYAELARIQVYSSASLSTDDEKRQRLEEALATINNGVKVADEDSNVHAIKAFVLDWYSTWADRTTILTQAEQEAVRAITIDPQNTLAIAYYGEILMDSMKYDQAEQYINQALEKDPSLMDIHRINGLLWEIKGNYLQAIESYKRAVEIMPNLTFLYINIGLNYRVLAANDPASPYYPPSLEYFAKAVRINAALGINDPIPYLAIAKTYSQMGEFFIASLNGQKALAMNPTNPDIYGQLGIIDYKGKNYEGAQVALKCAILGCTAAESCVARQCDAEVDPQIAIEGMPLSNNTVVYYYTYASVLAGLSIPQENKCAEAIEVFQMVREKYSSDPDIMPIVQEGETICRNINAGTPVPQTTLQPTAATTGTPEPTSTLIPR
jgi:tetratricopeptide (TPR) repeat protein